MGAFFSTPKGLPMPLEFCADQLKAANKCMSDLDYDREKYRTACGQLFSDYKNCRKSWKKLKTDLMTAELTGKIPDGVDQPQPVPDDPQSPK
ncbi:hypothetical protein HDU98_004153 [Podochytrium sp. JEL0797]|nr:hypothetical protein HDU98_004153 [Podochytrium sp. JEL0797]